MVINYGLTLQGMRATGRMTRLMDRASWCMLMGMCMRETGLMIRLMEKELTHMAMVPIIKEIG